jgi:hypothetical protein
MTTNEQARAEITRFPRRAQRYLMESRRPLAGCEYCGRPATFGFVIVPEPTERSTYADTWRELCHDCQDSYRDVPYGFQREA